MLHENYRRMRLTIIFIEQKILVALKVPVPNLLSINSMYGQYVSIFSLNFILFKNKPIVFNKLLNCFLVVLELNWLFLFFNTFSRLLLLLSQLNLWVVCVILRDTLRRLVSKS